MFHPLFAPQAGNLCDMVAVLCMCRIFSDSLCFYRLSAQVCNHLGELDIAKQSCPNVSLMLSLDTTSNCKYESDCPTSCWKLETRGEEGEVEGNGIETIKNHDYDLSILNADIFVSRTLFLLKLG